MKNNTNIEEISHIKRREIQAPIVSTIINGFIDELGLEKTLQILTKIIKKDAVKSGRELAAHFNGNGMAELVKVVKEIWCDEGAMEIEVLRENESEFHFNVTKCLYAEAYRKLGVLELGKCLSCDRDFPFNEGFNSDIKLERSKTIMEDDEICNFRYSMRNVK